MKQQRIFPNRPQLGILGMLGCLGFSYFYTGHTYTLVFFGFFAFFSYFWEGKMGGERPDERMVANRSRAMRQAYSGGFAAIFAGTVLIGNAFGESDVQTAYALTVALVALGFAVAQNVAAYLTYRYEKG